MLITDRNHKFYAKIYIYPTVVYVKDDKGEGVWKTLWEIWKMQITNHSLQPFEGTVKGRFIELSFLNCLQMPSSGQV